MVSAPLWNLFGIFLLQEHFVRSEFADVTGIVKYTRKRVFFCTNPPPNFFLGGGATGPLPPPPFYSAAYAKKFYICGGNPLCGSPFIKYNFRWGAAQYIFSIESTAAYRYRLSLWSGRTELLWQSIQNESVDKLGIYHELNSLSSVRPMKSSTFGLSNDFSTKHGQLFGTLPPATHHSSCSHTLSVY